MLLIKRRRPRLVFLAPTRHDYFRVPNTLHNAFDWVHAANADVTNNQHTRDYEKETDFEDRSIGSYCGTDGLRCGAGTELMQCREDDHQQIGVLSTWGYLRYDLDEDDWVIWRHEETLLTIKRKEKYYGIESESSWT